ncbi:hypothetical protein CAC42_750 [Sphaceloma murrayae]|uniref:Uncharacterized protein n=1 Tax=Sphaceloma murrayae TaxID=2082308 RepID=A0A2K1QKM0_9PEZI|nr:hypothetical protein CAC42_750 [Sphaceloma murrayae]
MTSSGIPPPPGVFLRERGRQASSESPRLSTPPLPRRRSSVLSYASDTRQSVQSSAGDFILPGLGIRTDSDEDETSHWHSSPLAFALLPAVGGLLFTNGSAFITDILLLGLAAIFLNWSVRLPWQWYHSAQAVRQGSSRRLSSLGERPDLGLDNPEASPSSKLMKDSGLSEEAKRKKNEEAVGDEDYDDQQEAVEKLRTHEKVALLSTFVLPALGAYLLHVIRSQLSKGSTALVSDYNLTIFLLAAEIRPFRQLIKLVTNRTLHLQRIANSADHFVDKNTHRSAEIESRLEVLEAKVSDPTSSPVIAPGQKEEMAQLSAELRKRYEPRIDALERAVRRYEKRVTTLTMLTDQRMQQLDSRLQDALSLAAVAAQSSQKPSIVATTMSYFARLVMMPVEAACFVIVWPIRVVEDTARLVLGTQAKSKRRSGERTGKTSSRAREKRPGREDVSAVPAGK